MNDQKFMVRSRYEKYEILLARPNKLSLTRDSVINTSLSILWQKLTNEKE